MRNFVKRSPTRSPAPRARTAAAHAATRRFQLWRGTCYDDNTMRAPLRWTLAAALSVSACSPSLDPSENVASARDSLAGYPDISNDFGLAPPVLRARRDVAIATVAAGPEGYLVLSGYSSDFTHHELLATRVLADGRITDPTGVTVLAVEGPRGTLAPVKAVRTGDHWLVVWEGFAVPVGDDGMPGTSVPLPLTGYLAGLSWDGTRALVTTTSGRGVFVSASGAPLGDAFAIFAPVGTGSTEAGGAIFDGTNHLVIWWSTSPPAVNVSSIASTGPTGKIATLYDPQRLTALAGPASLTAGSGSALALYRASPPSCALGGRCTPPVQYHRVLSSANDGTISIGVERELDIFASGTFTGQRYLLWDRGDVRFLDAGGAPTGTPGPLLGSLANEFFAEVGTASFHLEPSADRSALLAFAGHLAGRLTSELSRLDQALIAPIVFPGPQTTPFPAFGGDGYLAVWNDDGRGGIHAARVTRQGEVLDLPPVPVALGDHHDPFASASSAGTLVGWLTSTTLEAARISATGLVTPVDLAELASPSIAHAALGTNGTGYLLAAAVPVVAADPPTLRAALFSSDGLFSSKVDFEPQQARPAVTFDGEHYVVAWSVPNGSTAELRAARFTSSLELVDVPARALFEYPADPSHLAPGIASDGARSLVTWTEPDGSVRAARVGRNLEVLDPGGIVVATAALASRGVATAWDGASYWLVWQDGLASDARHVAVRGRRIGADGVPLDSAPFPVTDDLANISVAPNRALSLVADDTGGLLLTYVQDDDVARARTARARILRTASGGSGGLGGGGSGGTAGAAGNAAGVGGLLGGMGGTAGAAGGRGGEAGEAGDGGATAGEGGAPGASGEGGEGTTGGVSAGGGGAGRAGHSGASGAAGANVAGDSGGAGEGTEPEPPPAKPDGGCGCSVPAQRKSFGWVSLLALGAACVRRREGRRVVGTRVVRVDPGD